MTKPPPERMNCNECNIINKNPSDTIFFFFISDGREFRVSFKIFAVFVFGGLKKRRYVIPFFSLCWDHIQSFRMNTERNTFDIAFGR